MEKPHRQGLNLTKGAGGKHSLDKYPDSTIGSGCYFCCIAITGVLLAILVFSVFGYLSIAVWQWTVPQCGRPFGRVCNNRGVCTNGVCICDELYSGQSCTDTQVPGYNLALNQECSNNGFAYPFINQSIFCYENVTNGVREGPGWGSPDCVKFLNVIRQEIQARGGNPLVVPTSIFVPLCTCNVGFSGPDCSLSSCPTDENGYICGNNGNTSVGLLTNYTNAGYGCQCSTPLGLFRQPYVSYLTPSQRATVSDRYFAQFNRLYCGVAILREGVLSSWTPPDAYKCYCNDGWKGVSCTQGQCPFNPQTKAICYGRGAPELGQGRLTNTSLSSHRGLPCTVDCVAGNARCQKQRCIPVQSPTVPLYNDGAYCANPGICPRETPIRCFDGTCQSIPTLQSQGCLNRYIYGSLDHGRLDLVQEEYTCQNITSNETFSACFGSNTSISGVIEYQTRGGIVWDANETLVGDLGSPLLFMEFSTNYSGILTITNFDGQFRSLNVSGPDLVVASFVYNDSQFWIDVWNETEVELTNLPSGFYACPMPWNYSGAVNIPANYSLIRLRNPLKQITLQVVPDNSALEVFSYTGVDSWILVQSPNEGLYLHPIGLEVTRATCLSEPAICSWYSNGTAIRSLDSVYWICSSGGLPAISLVPCSDLSLVIDYLENWRTCSTVTPTIDITYEAEIFTVLQRNYTNPTSFPFNISFGVVGDQNTTLVLDPLFLTQARVTYPCACPPDLSGLNRSQVNEIWWEENTVRAISYDTVAIGDYVLGGDFGDGDRDLIRGRIVTYDQDGDSFLIQNPQSSYSFSAYKQHVRTITSGESLEGNPDCDLLETPGRCPDGSCSRVQSSVNTIPASCNCTWTPPLAYCSCLDTYNTTFDCQCNATASACTCGLPATPDFELDFWNEIDSLTTTGCNCLIYTSLNTTLSLTSDTGIFDIENDQVPTHIVVTSSGSDFVVSATSTFFENITVDFSFDYIADTGEWFLTLYTDPAPAFTQINVSVTGLVSATLLLSPQAFSLFQLDPQPTFRASSNSVNASNVNLLNSSYWLSSTYDLPVFLIADMGRYTYPNASTIIFYKAGNATIEDHIYLQGRNGQTWVTLGGVGAYVEEGGWLEKQIYFNTSLAFDKYRLISLGAQFGIRRWDIFAEQLCTCDDNSILTLQLTDLREVPTLDDLLSEIAYFEEHIGRNGNCSCENACVITAGTNLTVDVSNDGVCQDFRGMAPYMGFDLSPIVSTVFTQVIEGFSIREYSSYTSELAVVQFANDAQFLLDSEEIDQFYPLYSEGVNIKTNLTNGSLVVLLIYYFRVSDFVVVPYNDSLLLPKLTYVNNTNNITVTTFATAIGSIISQGISCNSGDDCADCGPSSRDMNEMPGYTCSLTAAQNLLLSDISSQNVLVNKTLYIRNLTGLSYTAFYQDITLSRRVPFYSLIDCPLQTCATTVPFQCPDGSCVATPDGCATLYTCPGNGCVEQTDVSNLKAYRCACSPGYGGDGCQYGQCLGATPYQLYGVPASEECTCGGPPPMREKPPILNIFQILNPQTIVQLNNRITGNSAPRSALDVDYLRIMPQNGPWGRVIRYSYTYPGSALVSNKQRTIYTTCPFMRRGYFGEYIFLTDDVLTRNQVTGQVTSWRTYTNPFTGVSETFPWQNITSYNDFPYRCKNGQCVADESFCRVSEEFYPLCNGRGICNADGSCTCNPGWKTFSVNEVYSISIRYPYQVVDGVPDPTAWVLNWNWKHHGLNQCTARDCEVVDCSAPVGCFPGTPSLNFADRQILCTGATGNSRVCAASLDACLVSSGLTAAVSCNGKGIPRRKDFTGEFYCACGDPISDTLNITAVSQITQLKKNGWGGPACSVYFATSAPILWSPWNFEIDASYRSLVTGDPLPGIWVSGIRIMGPDPDDRLVWESCCPGYSRLELCPNVPCRIEGKIQCTASSACFTPNTPLVYPCNNHGVARADGTCECEIDEQAGTGYTFDYSQFSVKGCYKYVQCPLSRINNEACNFKPACSAPAEWLHPLSYDPYLEQQWFTCGVLGQGLYSNETKLNSITANVDAFNEQVVAALSGIALDVLAQETALASCICVYPSDTTNSKYGMLPGASLTYQQNYASPYFLNGTVPLWPNLTDGTLESLGYESHLFSTGDVISFYLTNNASTTLSAYRIFGERITPVASVRVLSGGSVACGTEVFLEVNTLEGLQWSVLSGGVSRCGPTYQCLDLQTQPGYDSECIIPTSQKCTDWKETTCESSTLNKYWPLDSQAVYQGCSRGSIECDCCQFVSSFSNTPVTNGIIELEIVNGTVQIGQVQFYGYTTAALESPAGLVNTLSRSFSGDGIECKDYIFYSSYLSANRNPYAAQLTNEPQQSLALPGAKDACIYTGGFLGAAADATALTLLQKTCANIKQSGALCWVAARDVKLNDQYIGRTELFETGCDKCIDTLYLTNLNYRFFTFSTYPLPPDQSTDFKIPMAPTQYPTSTVALSFTNKLAAVYSPIHTETCCIWVIYYDKVFNGEIGQYIYDTTYTSVWKCIDGSTMNKYITPERLTEIYYSVNIYEAGIWKVQNRLRTWQSVYTDPPFCAALGLYPNEPQRGTRPSLFLTYYPEGDNFSRGWTYLCSGFPNPVPCRDPFGNIFTSASFSLPNEPWVWATPWNIGPFSGGQPHLMLYDINLITNPTTSGSFGRDFFPGYREYNYLPAFLTSRLVICSWLFPNPTPEGSSTACLYDSTEFAFDLSTTTPYYFNSNPFAYAYTRFTDTLGTLTYPTCGSCMKSLSGDFQWNSYLFYTASWPTLVDQQISNYVVNIKVGLTYYSLPDLYVNVSDFKHFIAAHQITFIESRARTLASANRASIDSSPTAVPWRLNSCLVVGPDPTAPLGLGVCEDTANQYLCNYDYVKYTTISGYDCPSCGPNGREGPEPIPAATCFDEFPLANSTAYPYQHQIKNAYLAGTLDIYAESFNTPVDDIDFTNTSIIWGFPPAWLAWKNGVSTRAGQLSRGSVATPNWCDLCLTCNWPVDCGIQRDPTTNAIVRYCASNQEYCNLNAANAPEAPVRDIPPLFDPTLPSFLTTDPTCGYIYKLRGYAQTDKFGVKQDILDDYFVFLSTSETYVQLQVKDIPAWYFNGGKTNTNFKFETNVTTYVSGKYFIQSCISCSSPTLEIFIHPLSPLYSFPESRISVTVPLVQGQLGTYVVSYTVSQAQSGETIINGQSFPSTVYRAIGFELHGLGIGSSIYLYNPLATTNTTQALCQNRTQPSWTEPVTRIQSSSPLNKCILSELDQLDFPGVDIGTCACALDSAGRTCDCPAVLSKYGKEVCGGVGDEGTSVVGYDGNTYTTGTGQEAGCFVLGERSDCKTIDLARAGYTLQVTGAVWEYPSVYVERPPTDGEGVFVNIPNVEQDWLTKETIAISCSEEAATMPYYLSSDELNQLLQQNLFLLPVFMGTTPEPGYPLSVPWSEAAALGGYFLNQTTGSTEVAAIDGDITCTGEEELCKAINFNNWAFFGTSAVACINDGNTVQTCGTSGILTLPPDAPLETTVIGFGSGTYVRCTVTELCDGVGPEWTCRCANRKIEFDANFREVQVFDSQDLTRSCAYTY